MELPGIFELFVLLTVRRLAETNPTDANCANITKVLTTCGVERSLAQVHVCLQRLKDRKLVRSIHVRPPRQKGRDLFSLTQKGEDELSSLIEIVERLR